MFFMDNNRFPSSLQELVQRPGDVKIWPKDGYLHGATTAPDDPWGNPFEYRAPGPDGHDYTIISRGEDGKDGGDDFAADLSCWETGEK